MPHTVVFPMVRLLPHRPRPFRRPLGAKFQEIAIRSPQDIAAFDKIADLVLARLNEGHEPPSL